MRLEITLGCSICGFKNERSVKLPFDCDKFLCPKCGESCCLSIMSVTENTKVPGSHINEYSLQDLYKIRQL
jgi:hypothetical protein